MISLPEIPRRLRPWLVGLAALFGVLLVCVAVAYLARARVLTWVGSQLVHADPLEPADALVVLGGGLSDRLIEAADLYLADYAPLVVLTRPPEPSGLIALKRRGVNVELTMERQLRYFRELGVPASGVTVLSETVISTDQEASLVARWAQSRDVQSLIIVTSRFHTGRSHYIFDRKFRDTGITIRIHPSRFKRFDPESWWQSRQRLREGLFEFQKLIFYRLRY